MSWSVRMDSVGAMRTRAALVLTSTVLAVGGCGGSVGTAPRAAPAAARHAASARPAHRSPVAAKLGVVGTARLPAAVQLPAVTVRAGEALALGGLDSADTSTAAVVHLAPGPVRD